MPQKITLLTSNNTLQGKSTYYEISKFRNPGARRRR